jgi:hypothetical protein
VGDRFAARELAQAEPPHQFVDVASPFVDVPRDDGEPIDWLQDDSPWSRNEVHRTHRGAPFRKTSAHLGGG